MAPPPPADAKPAPRARDVRQRQGLVVSGILSVVLILALMQLWLLAATMNAYLGGDRAIVWPALGASFVCLLLNLGLLRYLRFLERQG